MRDGLVRVDAMNCGLNGAGHAGRIAGCTHRELREIHRSLKIINENGWLWRFVEFSLARVGDHPHDFGWILHRPAKVQFLANRVAAGEESFDKFLVHDDNVWRAKKIPPVKWSAAHQRRSHGLKVTGADDQKPGSPGCAGVRRRLTCAG